jgi:aspartate kinase
MNAVKAIACKRRLTVLELRHKNAGNLGQLATALREMCERHSLPAEFVCQTGGAIFLALKNTSSYRDLPVNLDGCMEVRLHPRAAVLTLVGAGIAQSPDLPGRALSALKQIPAMLVTDSEIKIAVSVIVPDHALERSLELLHREFFSQVDPSVFAVSLEAGFQSPQPIASFVDSAKRDSWPRVARLRVPLTPASQN